MTEILVQIRAKNFKVTDLILSLWIYSKWGFPNVRQEEWEMYESLEWIEKYWAT